MSDMSGPSSGSRRSAPAAAAPENSGDPRDAAGSPRRLVAPLGTLAAVVAAFGLVAVVDPHEPGHYPVCPLWRFTGLWCPGCGGLRSAHAVAHGRLGAALEANALAVAGFAVFAVCWSVWFVTSLRGRPLAPAARSRAWLGWVFAGVVLVFGIVRNLSFAGALAP